MPSTVNHLFRLLRPSITIALMKLDLRALSNKQV